MKRTVKFYSKKKKMEKRLIALERSKFNYLYKYDFCQIAQENIVSNIVSNNLDELLSLAEKEINIAGRIIERALPIFEQEHEVILIEYLSKKIKYSSGLVITFDGVLRIIPLNSLAKDLLSSKLNQDFKYGENLPDDLYKEIVSIRQDKIRNRAATNLLACFSLQSPSKDFKHLVYEAAKSKIAGLKPVKEDSSLHFLLDFETTPSGIPEGNIEGLMKLICVGMIKVTGDTNKLRQSPLYNLLYDHQNELNKGSLFNSFETFKSLVKENESIERLESTLTINVLDSDILLFFYLYMSFKKILQQNDFDLHPLMDKYDIGKNKYPREFSQAIYLIGYILSMSTLFESLQKLKKSPLFGFDINVDSEEKDIAISPMVKDSKEPYTVGDTIDYTVGDTIDSNDKEKSNPEEVQESKKGKHLEKPKAEEVQKEVGDLFGAKINAQKELLNRVKNEVKGSKKKEVIGVISDLILSNPDFSFDDLQLEIRKPNYEFLTKKNAPIKAAQDALDIFKALNL